MDITSDGFGFMLALAITIEPFLYSLQARYLVFNPIELGSFYTALILAVNLLGYHIFRVANAEKNDFRNGRNPKSKLRCDLRTLSMYVTDKLRRPTVHDYGERQEVADFGMVGKEQTSQLHVRVSVT